MVVKKVIPIVPVVPPPDISWCIKPLFLWMRVLGIELDPISNPFRRMTYTYGLSMLILCQWASISLTLNFLKFSFPVNSSNNSNVAKSATFGWNVWIDMINHFTLMGIVCPAFFYIAHSQRWRRLSDAIKKFQCQRNRGKIGRNFVFVGFVPILSVSRVASER